MVAMRQHRMAEVVERHQHGFDAAPDRDRRTAGHVPTTLIALDDALTICHKLNCRLGYDRDTWTAMADASIQAEDDGPIGDTWHRKLFALPVTGCLCDITVTRDSSNILTFKE